MKNPFSAPTDPEDHGNSGAGGKGQQHHPTSSRQPSPEFRELTAEQQRSLSSSMYLTATLMFATLVTSMMPLPVRMAAVVFAAWGGFAGIRTVVLASRLRVSVFQRFAVVLGVGLTTFLGLSVALTVTRWDVEMTFQECHRQAVTVHAANSCDSEYRDSLSELYGGVNLP